MTLDEFLQAFGRACIERFEAGKQFPNPAPRVYCTYDDGQVTARVDAVGIDQDGDIIVEVGQP